MINRIKKIARNALSHIMENRAAYAFGILVFLNLATAAGWTMDHKRLSKLVFNLQTILAILDSGSWAGTRLQQCPRKIR